MMSETHPTSAETDPRSGYDRSQIHLKALIWFVVIFIAFGAAAHVLLAYVWKGLDQTRPEQNASQSALMSQTVVTPTPRLQPSPGDDATPAVDLQRMRTSELEEFKRRGWFDEQSGKVRIPDTIVQQVTQSSGQKGASK